MMSRRGPIVGSPTGMRRVAFRVTLLAAAVCVLGLLMLADEGVASADSSGSGPASSSSYDPAASFTGLEYQVRFYQRIFSATLWTDRLFGEVSTDGRVWFGEVTADERSADLDLSFAVEGQHDPAGYQFCETPSTCETVNVRVSSAGLLYLHIQRPTLARHQYGYFADFPIRTVELSATDADTSLKVYREVLVGPPEEVTGCEDYGEDNPDAYACLFLREVIPEGIGGSSEATLRAGLPGLVQGADSYSLVFAEEFDGTPPPANAAGCSDSVSTLDSDVWNYVNVCHSDFVDSLGEPCGNVVSGKLVVAMSGNCRFVTNTFGKLHAKYGYVEIKFTVNMDHWSAYHNYNIIMYAFGDTLRYVLDRYGIEIDDWEDYLTNLDTEIDIMEFDVGSRAHIGHQYGNYHYRFANRNIRPTWSSKWYAFCGRTSISIIENPNLPCRSTDTFTTTLGIEWTPRGYRTFVKVDEFHDDMFVVPKDKIDVNVKHVSFNGVGPHRAVTGSARDPYFEYVDPDDTDTLLEQVAVTHVPLPINIGAWGYMSSEDHPHIRTRMKIDYIRLWQPDDHYSTMEPVYQ